MKLHRASRYGWLGLFSASVLLITLVGCQGMSGGSQSSSTAAGKLSASSTSLNFGSVAVGQNASLSETLTNAGGSSVTISATSVTKASFTIAGLALPTTLGPNQSVTFTANFAPSASGAASSTAAIVSDAANSPLNIALAGTGAAQGQLSVSPSTLSFGNVVVGANSSLAGNLTASGASVIVSSASSNSGEFALSGVTLPATLQAGQSVPFTVTFTPNASGTASATLTFSSNGSNSPTAESLTGSGSAAAPHSVSLSWTASSGAVAYNIYRKLIADTNYARIGSGDVTTLYTDYSVAAGQSYDYVVTAVDSSNVESGYSNIAQVTIPTP